MMAPRQDLVDRLVAAVRGGRAIAPLTDEVDLDIDDAYDVRDAVVAVLDPDGAPRAAKLGLTSRAKQVQMSVDEPLYGWFLSGSQLDLGEPLVVDSLIQPRVEPEIGFLIGRELGGPGVTATQVLAATTAVMPGIDVLDSRFSGYAFTLPDVAADNSSAAKFVVGNPVPVGDTDLSLVGCVFEHNGDLVATAAGAAVLEHPAASVAWLVRKLAERGEVLAADTIVMAGALTRAVAVAPGDHVRVTIDRIGSVELRCE